VSEVGFVFERITPVNSPLFDHIMIRSCGHHDHFLHKSIDEVLLDLQVIFSEVLQRLDVRLNVRQKLPQHRFFHRDRLHTAGTVCEDLTGGQHSGEIIDTTRLNQSYGDNLCVAFH